ncbi:hypothetical protein HELRODRAFT_184656 [Helobdella robusta]|uniref:MULE transposase domain-containing protein n=1 Tax=Helobdella robusta TaxID=6412 RepID=T1FLP5_HELRO|nr:hypothetical protein HELRODRAFT_184656 [Helobdella robusta]ESO07438.1 hypothetical protein HELRODRAFT_184656 [Helobdella robusta]
MREGNENVIIYDSGANPFNRIIVFSTFVQLQQMGRSTRWFMDGNFSLSPNIFHQLYFIRVAYLNHYVTCAYALMTSRNEEVFRAIKDKAQEHNIILAPTTVIHHIDDMHEREEADQHCAEQSFAIITTNCYSVDHSIDLTSDTTPQQPTSTPLEEPAADLSNFFSDAYNESTLCSATFPRSNTTQVNRYTSACSIEVICTSHESLLFSR